MIRQVKVASLQLAKTEDYTTWTYTLHFRSSIKNFSAYNILSAALFSAPSSAERLHFAGSLAIISCWFEICNSSYHPKGAFMIGFLHYDPAPIGFKVIPMWSPANLYKIKGKGKNHLFQQTYVGEWDCMTSPQSVCVGDYSVSCCKASKMFQL